MTAVDTNVRVAEEGVFFSIAANGLPRTCLISKNALAYLGRVHGGSTSAIGTYTAFESNIHAVAQRLIVAGESASPLILGAAYFVGNTRVQTAES